MPGLHPLSPWGTGGRRGGGGKRLRVDDGVYYERAAGETGAKGVAAGRAGRGGWRDACSRFPYRRGTVVCAFMKICQTHPRPLPHPLLPHGSFVVSPLLPSCRSHLSAPSVPSPRTSCNDRIRASGGRSLAIVVFPRFYSRCDRCIIAKRAISTRSAAREEGQRGR